MTVAESAAGGGNNNKKVMFKNSAPFSDCKSETNNTQVDIHKDIDVVATIYNLIEHSNSYLDTFYGNTIEMNRLLLIMQLLILLVLIIIANRLNINKE